MEQGRGVPAWLRWAYCIASFAACLMWIDLLTEEMIAVLEAFGFYLNVPLDMIGITALAWANSVPDGFVACILARQYTRPDDVNRGTFGRCEAAQDTCLLLLCVCLE